jgi:hypothetical protein
MPGLRQFFRAGVLVSEGEWVSEEECEEESDERTDSAIIPENYREFKFIYYITY